MKSPPVGLSHIRRAHKSPQPSRLSASSYPKNRLHKRGRISNFASRRTKPHSSVPMAAVPLPSPTAAQPSRYFNQASPATSKPQQPQQPQQYSLPNAAQSQIAFQPAQSSQQQLQPQPQPPPPYSPPRRGTVDGGPSATSPFLRDFNLVAEAAKRAELAVLMRDLDAVAL